MGASNTILERCSLTDVRLIESSSKLYLPDVERGATIKIHFSHDIAFSPISEGGKIDFTIDIDSKLKAILELEKDEKEVLALNGKFRGGYKIYDKKKNPIEKFENSVELFGFQLYPIVRIFLNDILLKMGTPIPLPWSITSESNNKNPTKKQTQRKKATIKKRKTP